MQIRWQLSNRSEEPCPFITSEQALWHPQMVPERADATCRLCTGLFDSEENYCTNEMSGWIELNILDGFRRWYPKQFCNSISSVSEYYTTKVKNEWQYKLKSYNMDNNDEQSYCTLIYSSKWLWHIIPNESNIFGAPPLSHSVSLNVFHHYIHKKCGKYKHTVRDCNVW